MKLHHPALSGHLIKRYKRFLADVKLTDGRFITAHTPNTGAMLGCAEPGSRIWLYNTHNANRKYPYSWDLVEDTQGHLIGIHTGKANYLVREAIENKTIRELQGYEHIKPEVNLSHYNTRFDFLLSATHHKPDCFVEVKNVTAKHPPNTAIFPDAISARGKKHLEALSQAVQLGYRAVIFFCIQRNDIKQFMPATDIDPAYADTLRTACDIGVEALAYKAKVTTKEITLYQRVPIILKE